VNSSPRAIHHLNCGTMCPHGARLLAGEGGLLASARLVCHCLLIEGAEGLVLIDTGFGLDDVRRPRQLGIAFNAITRPQLEQSETAILQVRALGFEPSDVRHIITTHLDLDHAGGLPDFPDAEVHLLGRELEAALHPGLRERTRYISAHWAHGPHWVQHAPEGESWMGFESVRALPDSNEEILLIPLPGHTLGHCGMVVNTSNGLLLDAGDAFFDPREVNGPKRQLGLPVRLFEAIVTTDKLLRVHNQNRLRELAASHPEVTVFAAHDPTWTWGGAQVRAHQ